MNLEEKILNEKIKIYKVNNGYRIYGETYEVKEELKDIGASWNKDKKVLELSEEKFNELSEIIKEKVFELEKKQREMSLENIVNIIMTGQVKVYLNKNEEYQIYGRTKELYKDLKNIGFDMYENNYVMKKENFERTFSNEVKEFINEYSNKEEVEEQEILEDEEEEMF